MGPPQVDLFAATSGTDSDWVVKLIDVYPNETPEGASQGSKPDMSGFELPIGIEIFRGRYVDSFAKPRALRPGKVEHYRWGLPNVNHVFLPGHRIMVQVQSSLFPLYDRNPQTFVPNIFYAKARRLPQGDAERLPRRRDGERGVAAGRALAQRLRPARARRFRSSACRARS